MVHHISKGGMKESYIAKEKRVKGKGEGHQDRALKAHLRWQSLFKMNNVQIMANMRILLGGGACAIRKNL